MGSPNSVILALAVAAFVVAACSSAEDGADRGRLSSETECMTATDASACKRDNDIAGGVPMTLPQGSGDGSGGARRSN